MEDQALETVTSGEFSQSEDMSFTKTQKILVQRVFHKTENDSVQERLEYIVADSESEITKHVFGGLFNKKYYAYIPENYCRKHKPNLFEFQDESLPKIGDKFDSLESFRLYIDSNARNWKYYLKCGDSHRKNGKDNFVFQCVFARPRRKLTLAKGIRKRTRKVPVNDCPCRVLLKKVPPTANDLTVIYVCNHHDHPLTDDYFNKLQHGRRLHPSVKEEIMDVLSLDVPRLVVKKYFHELTGYTMRDSYFANITIFMKKNKIERQFSLEKLKEMSKKIERIKEELGISDEIDNGDNPDRIAASDVLNRATPSQLEEVFNVLNTVSAVKKPVQIRRKHVKTIEETEIKPKKRKKEVMYTPDQCPRNLNMTSRLETRLQELKYDEETLQSIKYLQDSVRCENTRHSWAVNTDHSSGTSPSMPAQENYLGNPRVFQTEPSVEEQSNGEAIIETVTECQDFGQTEDIFYTNEVTVQETNEEQSSEHTVFEDVVENTTEYAEVTSHDASYCIQYEQDSEQANETLLLLESLEKLPVQVKATELATVNIMPKNLNHETMNVSEQYIDIDTENIHAKIETNEKEERDQSEDCVSQINEIAPVKIEVNEENPNDAVIKSVCEILTTNDRKIFPSREVVNTVILNKPDKDLHKVLSKRKIKRKTSKNYSSRNRRKPRIRKHYSYVESQYNSDSHDYFSTDDYEVYDNVTKKETKIEGPFSNYLDDCDDLEDDDNYLIIVNGDDEHGISEEESISPNKVEHNDYNILKSNDKEVQCNLSDTSEHKSIKNEIQILKRVKSDLINDIKYLTFTKKNLKKEIRNLNSQVEHK